MREPTREPTDQEARASIRRVPFAVGVTLALVPLVVAALVLGGVFGRPGTVGDGASAAPLEVGAPVTRQVATTSDLEVTFTARPVGPAGTTDALRAGDLADLTFALTDPEGAPLGLRSAPVVWLDSRESSAPGTDSALSCQDKMRMYAQRTFGFRPEVDLNDYKILTLNSDASLSVIDPLGGINGVTQLFDMVYLPSPGEDWATNVDGTRLFVTMPAIGQVAVVDTENFELLTTVDAGDRPVRILADPSGQRVWVTDDEGGGVVVIDTGTLQRVATIATGAGRHELAFTVESTDGHPHGGLPVPAPPADDHAGHDHGEDGSGRDDSVRQDDGGDDGTDDGRLDAPEDEGRDDSRDRSRDDSRDRSRDDDAGRRVRDERSPSASGAPVRPLAVVTNGDDDTVSVIDLETLEKVGDVAVSDPVALAYAGRSEQVYVGSVTGEVTAIDAESATVVGVTRTDAGVHDLGVAPGGRWAFVVNELRDRVDVIDTVAGGVSYSTKVEGSPDTVTFSDGYAYVRSRETPQVGVIALAGLGEKGDLPIVEVIGGQKAPEVDTAGSASAIVSHHGRHVLIANPSDNYVYDYMEGMNAPMGGFTNYAPGVRAARTVGYDFRERAAGEYGARVRLPRAATYQVGFLLDEPQTVRCFELTVDPEGS